MAATELTLARGNGTVWTINPLILWDLVDHGDAEPVDEDKGKYRLIDNTMRDEIWEAVVMGHDLYDAIAMADLREHPEHVQGSNGLHRARGGL